MSAPAIPFALPDLTGAVNTADCVCMGFTVRETTGTTSARARLRTGAGVVLAEVTLLPEESVREWFGPGGILAQGGIYYELIAGTTSGGVFAR